jgi:hypothetical protein
MKSVCTWDLIAVWWRYMMSSPMSSKAHLAIGPMVRWFLMISPSTCDVTTWTG